MSGDLSKHQGIYIGKVLGSTGQGKAVRGSEAGQKGNRQRGLVTIQLSRSYSRIYAPYDAVLKGFFRGDDRIVPIIPNITKGYHDRNIRENFDKLVAVSASKGIAVGSLGWIGPFVEAGVNVFGDYGLNLYNSMDFSLAGKLGIKEALVSHEAALKDILAMNFHGVAPEIAVGGKIPVMISEHCVASDLNFCSKKCEQTNIFLKDRRGSFTQSLQIHRTAGVSY